MNYMQKYKGCFDFTANRYAFQQDTPCGMPHGLKQCGYCIELGLSVNMSDEDTANRFDPSLLDVDRRQS